MSQGPRRFRGRRTLHGRGVGAGGGGCGPGRGRDPAGRPGLRRGLLRGEVRAHGEGRAPRPPQARPAATPGAGTVRRAHERRDVDRPGGSSTRPPPAADRHLDFALFDRGDDVASARIFTEQFNDYLLLARQDGRWRIVSVLWQVPASAGSEQDKAAVKKTLGEFFEGLYALDAARVRAVVHPELVRRTLRPGAGDTARPRRRQRRPAAGCPAADASGEGRHGAGARRPRPDRIGRCHAGRSEVLRPPCPAEWPVAAGQHAVAAGARPAVR